MSDQVQANAEDQVVSVDFSDVEEMDFTPIPRGKYTVRIVEAQTRVAQSSGNQYVAVSYVVEDYGDGAEYAGRRLWSNYTLTQKSLWNLKGMLIAAGMTKEELQGQFTLDVEALLDVVINVGVGVEKDQNGEDRNVVKRHYPAPASLEELELEVADEIEAEAKAEVEAAAAE